MNIITRSITSIARQYLRNSIEGNSSTLIKYQVNNNPGSFLETAKRYLHSSMQVFREISPHMKLIMEDRKLRKMHRRGPLIKKRKVKNPFNGQPFAKGVVLKTLIKKPKKPNSANRKCVLVRLSTGREMIAYVPGIGHNLQEHNTVLCKVGRCKDVPGVKIKCVRGVYDLPHVVKQKQK